MHYMNKLVEYASALTTAMTCNKLLLLMYIQAVPSVHLHAFSPEEVLYGAKRSGCSVREYLEQLKQAGVGAVCLRYLQLCVDHIPTSLL
jgi:2-iminoacetate synthase ThiH